MRPENDTEFLPALPARTRVPFVDLARRFFFWKTNATRACSESV